MPGAGAGALKLGAGAAAGFDPPFTRGATRGAGGALPTAFFAAVFMGLVAFAITFSELSCSGCAASVRAGNRDYSMVRCAASVAKAL